MDISLKHEDYKYLKIMADNTVEEVVECELALPEYMPEILRIIKSSATPKVTSCRLVGERITVDGVCDLRMIYCGEDGCLYSFSQSRTFTRYCENAEFNDCVDACARISVGYVNCRATGTKRADIKAGLSVKFCAYSPVCQDVVSLGETAGVQEKCKTIRAMSLGCRQTRQFSMSDTVPLDVPGSFIISTRAGAVCTETRKINNKIMIKGEAIADVCYVNANEPEKTVRLKHVIPINQILEFEGMDERFTGNVCLEVCAVDVIPKGESSGACNSFDIALGIDACVTMWEEKELLVICDAYAVNTSLELKKAPYKFYYAADEIRETFLCENNFTLSGDGISEILDIFGEVSSIKVKKEENDVNISGSLALSFIIKDINGNVSAVNKMMDYSLNRPITCDCKNVVCSPAVVLVSLDCDAKAGGVTVRAELNVVATVLCEKLMDVVVDITERDLPLNTNRNAITVYFPRTENESLWSIARRYNTTVDAIAEENCLEGDTTEKLKVLFIPAV